MKAGYMLDSLGNSCMCEEDYIAVSIFPLAFEYIPNCLTYTKRILVIYAKSIEIQLKCSKINTL